MRQRTSVIGINISRLAISKGMNALRLSGINFGNQLFTIAVKNQVRNGEYVNFGFNPDQLKEKYSSIVIPAANWINPRTDWGGLADKLDRTGLPIAAVGLGTQLKSLQDIRLVPPGTIRLVNLIAERCHSIGVRGEFTAEVLNQFGIKNCISIGCPSIFYHLQVPSYRKGWQDNLEKLAVSATRYALKKKQLGSDDEQRSLFVHALNHAELIIYQSEELEIKILAGESLPEEEELVAQYYRARSTRQLKTEILKKGRYYTSFDSWLSDMSKVDYFVGTRIHGAIASILAGTPAILFYHDNRTRELAEAMGIPSSPIQQMNLDTLRDRDYLIEMLSPQNFEERSKTNFEKLRNFYVNNSIAHNLPPSVTEN